jgi:polyisoprenyl-phosphate glycosyltransferase
MLQDEKIISNNSNVPTNSNTLSKKLISLILPCFNEEANIRFAYDSILEQWKKSDILQRYNYELVFIDDGSRDNTVGEVHNLIQIDKQVKLIELSRNFGKENALTAGLHQCLGNAAIMLDVDMQYPVEKLPEFITEWEKGFEVVVGIRDQKKTSNVIEKLGSKLFYSIMAKISETKIISGALDYRLIDRKVIKQFNRLTEHSRITRALIDWLGFKKTYISYTEKSRTYGVPAYNFAKRLQLALNSFVTHSFFPMIATGYLGLLIMCVTFPAGTFLFFNKFVFGDPINLNASSSVYLGILNAFLTGVTLACFGLTSNYIANIQKEAMNRPLFIVRNSSFETQQAPTPMVQYIFPQNTMRQTPVTNPQFEVNQS